MVSLEFRVPYLTKEQIEAEGWTWGCTIEGKSPMAHSFDKGKYTLLFFMDNNIQIFRSDWDITIYSGECKDVNTLRYVSKLLNIN